MRISIKDLVKKVFGDFPGGESIGIFFSLVFFSLFLITQTAFWFNLFLCFISFGFLSGIALIILFGIVPLERIKTVGLLNHIIWTFSNYTLIVILFDVFGILKIKLLLNSLQDYFVIGSFIFLIYSIIFKWYGKISNILTIALENVKLKLLSSGILILFAGIGYSLLYTFPISEKLYRNISLINYCVMITVLQTLSVLAILFAKELLQRKR